MTSTPDTHTRDGWPTDAERETLRQRGQAEATMQADAMRREYDRWLDTLDPQTRAEMEQTMRDLIAATTVRFDEWVRWYLHNRVIARANQDDKFFEQLCAEE